MQRDHIKDALYGAIEELITNPRYFWNGFGADYSQLTEHGEQAIKDLIKVFGHAIIVSREQELDRRAREITLNQLKKES